MKGRISYIVVIIGMLFIFSVQAKNELKTSGKWVYGEVLDVTTKQNKDLAITADFDRFSSTPDVLLGVSCESNTISIIIMNELITPKTQWTFIFTVDGKELSQQKLKFDDKILFSNFDHLFYQSLKDKKMLLVKAFNKTKTVNMKFSLDGFDQAFMPIEMHCKNK